MQITPPTTSTTKPCGIFISLPNLSEVYLPLEHAEVHADVIDVSAIVTVTQHFWQCSADRAQKAKYVFPVPARAAVCGFEMTTEDGTVITAVAKEKEEARREHEQAIAQGQMTGLVEHVTDDIFSISLGALPALQMVQAKTTYVLDLMDEDVSDQVRLQIPMHIGARYGVLPPGMQGARQIPPHRVSISADVRMQGAIKSITSPTHPTVLVSDSAASYAQRRAGYTSPDFLTQDFVLSIKADGLDAPRCFAQKTEHGATAIQLNIVPKFDLPPIPRQEYIFLVDRSGSMGGDRIETAKKTLVMLLRALPSQGTHFNIFSFGSHCNSLWPQSVVYDAGTLEHATQHVDSMSANYGGTEIARALQQVFKSRKVDTPTACFVLTDGESYNIDYTISTVDQAVKSAVPGAPLRVFTLGIGGTASTAMCEGIARAGNGVCLMSTTSEGIIGKCSKLVRASRTYILKNVSVDWGVRTDLAEAYRTGSTTLKTVRQAPAEVSAIYPGTRFVVFALIDDAAYTPPNEVVISAQRDGQGEVLQFSVPITTVEFPAGHAHGRLVPTLAARRAIMDLEDAGRGGQAADHKSTIVQLGTTYQLASKYTSFVAVDRRTRAELPQEPEQPQPAPVTVHHGPIGMGAAPLVGGMMSLRAGQSVAQPAATQMRWFRSNRGGGLFGSSAQQASASAAFGTGAPQQPPQASSFGAFEAAVPPPPQVGGAPSFAFGGPPPPPSYFPNGGSPAMFFGQARSTRAGTAPDAAGEAALQQRAAAAPPPPGSLFASPPPAALQASVSLFGSSASRPASTTPGGGLFGQNLPMSAFGTSHAPAPAVAPPVDVDIDALSPEDRVLRLVRLQAFDGSFPAVAALEKIVGKPCLAEAESLQVEQSVWATVLAIAYLQKHMQNQPELLAGLVEKAMDFLSQTPGVDVESLLGRAKEFIDSAD